MAVPESLINFIYLCTFGPAFVMTLLLLYIYRYIVHIVLWLQLRNKFVGLLDGADSVWAIEGPVDLSVINILALIEKDRHQDNANFLENFRCLARDRLVFSKLKKLTYRRNEKYGYYFWERCKEIDLAERVRWLDHDPSTCDGYCDDIYGNSFKKILQNVSNQPMPENHSSSWEILICRNCSKYFSLKKKKGKIDEYKCGNLNRPKRYGDTERVPVLFRVHHSLGDGPALVRLLMEAFADQRIDEKSFIKIEEGTAENEYKVTKRNADYTEISVPVPTFNGKTVDIHGYKSDIVDWHYAVTASMPFTYFITLRLIGKFMQDYFGVKLRFFKVLSVEDMSEVTKTYLMEMWERLKHFVLDVIYEKIKKTARMISTILSIPTFLAQQAIQSMDNSALHGPCLTGERLITYWSEGDFRSALDHKLTTKIRDIKSITGARFVDVVLAALSSSLHKYFSRIKEAAPKTLTVVLPSRMEAPTESLTLRNGFSVGLLPLCVSNVNGETVLNPDENSNTLNRLYDITKAHKELKERPDYIINFWVIKFVCAAFPATFLKLVLQSHCTMVLSNVVGSEEVQVLGCPLKSIIFWTPNRSTTGIGFSILSYGENLQFSLAADKAVMKNEKLLSEILQNTIHEIDNLHDELTSSSFSKTLQKPTLAAMKNGVGVL